MRISGQRLRGRLLPVLVRRREVSENGVRYLEFYAVCTVSIAISDVGCGLLGRFRLIMVDQQIKGLLSPSALMFSKVIAFN